MSNVAALKLLAGSIEHSGSADGTGAAAGFNQPFGLAVAGDGQVYVADTFNHTIRRLSPSGVVGTLAGRAGVLGTDDGNAVFARLAMPRGVAALGSDQIVITEAVGRTVRRITLAGNVSTLAGTAERFGSADGVGLEASFNSPWGVAADSAGTLYVADTFNNTLRKVSPGGVVSTLTGTPSTSSSQGDGVGAAAGFGMPVGLAVDKAGNVLVAEASNLTIRKVSPAGVVSTLAGSALQVGADDGSGPAARFRSPLGMAADSSGNLYVADADNHTIRKITPAGAVSTVVGVAGVPGFVPGALPGGLVAPQGVAISGRTLYITTGHGVAVVSNLP